MRIVDWFRPGIRIKRWFILAVAGVACISLGLSFMIRQIYMNLIDRVLSVFLLISGCLFIYIAIKYFVKTFLRIASNNGFKMSLDSDKLSNLLYEKRILIKGPKIVAIGGGTGLSTMLRGLKDYSTNITAVVTVADDGGGSGVLRQDLGILPPGDIRNCVLALADTEPIMQRLLEYRFNDGMLKGQSFGNLFLAAMDGISQSFEEAVRKMSDVLAVTGRVMPVTLQDMRLCAELQDETIICGESKIGKREGTSKAAIKRVFLDPAEVAPLPEVLEAIREADIIVLGPGSLYTSIIPNLLVAGMAEEVKKAHGIKVYVSNVMTQPGETDGYSVGDHLAAIERHSARGIIDYCIFNTADIPEELKTKYREDGAEIVRVDRARIEKSGIQLIGGDFASFNSGFVRHHPDRLAAAVIDLVAEEVLSRDKKRMIDYYYVKDRLKKISVL